MTTIIDVAAGVLLSADNKILLAQRPAGKHMAGYWEFPGGKFEAGETAEQALARELQEELGVDIAGSEPLIEIVHHYPERSVRLHVRVVRDWDGEPQNLDQQALEWVAKSQLTAWDLLPADGPIVNAITLPDCYAISPETKGWTETELVAQLRYWQQQGVRFLQWRQAAFSSANTEPSKDALAQARRVVEWAQATEITVLLNCPLPEKGEVSWAAQLGFSGVHVKSQYLYQAYSDNAFKQVAAEEGLQYVGVSCHSANELLKAQQYGTDFAVLGPVKPTLSHPGGSLLGWQKLRKELKLANVPVYALGGCELGDLLQAKACGAQGIAAISAFERP